MKQLLITFLLVLLMGAQVYAQSGNEVLTLEECYDILYNEHPVRDKIQMSRQIEELNQRVAQSGWYPDLQINASASYQSDVVEFPFDAPNFDIPSFSKDHYNLSLNLTQPIFDGGRTSAAKALEESSGAVTEATLEKDLLNLKEQVDRIYFGLLTLQKQLEIQELVVDELQEQLELVKSQIEHGVLLPGNEASLRAEILRREQESTKIKYDLKAGYEAMSEILGIEIQPDQTVQLPDYKDWQMVEFQAIRPELEIIEARRNLLGAQQNFVEADKLPTVSVYVRPFYGRPGFNFFEDDLQFNWIVGIQARWSLKNARNATIKSDAINLQQMNLSQDRELFDRQQQATLTRFENQIKGIEEQIERDREIVHLQSEVTEEKQSLVEQGAAHVTEYISAMNAYSRAQLQLELRKIQRIQAIINYETEQGWTWN